MLTWNSDFEASPPNSQSPSLGALRIREVKQALRQRMELEHFFLMTRGGTKTEGQHLTGSAMMYYGNTAPTVRPDGVTSLNSQDVGRLWLDTGSTHGGVLNIFDGSSWVKYCDVPVGGTVAHNANPVGLWPGTTWSLLGTAGSLNVYTRLT
jgi:hypothetical protein